MELVTLGEILIDMFPAETGRRLVEVSAFLPAPGGAPANVAVAAARLGAKSAFIGKVGDDLFGHFLSDTLEENRVDIRGIRYDPEVRTTLAIIAKPDEFSAEFMFYRNPGADLMLTAAELDQSLLQSTRAFHFGSLSLVAEPALSATHRAIELTRQAGALVSFDVNYRPSLWKNPEEALERIRRVVPQVNLIKVNETEVKLLSDSDDLNYAGKLLLDQGPELVVVTLGEKGSHFFTRSGSGFIPAFQVKTVDAIGCGDAFIAGLLTCLLKSPDWHERLSPEVLKQDMRFANAVGALTALKKGVIPALPNKTQVEEFLRLQP